MGHAEDDLFHAERAAALDDLFKRRDHRFAAVETEPLGASELQIDKFLESFGLDQLVEDGALALAREGDLLVRPSMRACSQDFSAGSEMCMNS